MKLRIWLTANRVSITEFAKKIGISRGHLHHVMSGAYPLSEKKLKKIIELTGNKVSCMKDILWLDKEK